MTQEAPLGLFKPFHADIAAFLARQQAEGKVTVFRHAGPTAWPGDKNRNLVLSAETAVELGHPKDASTAFLYWVDDPSAIVNGRITLVGPDLPALAGRRVPFARVVIVGGAGFDAQNSLDRYREMELLRYDVHLGGYMMRGASQYRREWSRVSRRALEGGLSFRIIGGALVNQLLKLDYVRSVEILFVTSGKDDVKALKAISRGIFDRLGAMDKMADGLSFDCDTCAFTEVCKEASQLREMHRALKEKRKAAHG